MRRFVGDLYQRVFVFDGNAADGFELSIQVQRGIAGTREGDDLHVQSMRCGKIEQARQCLPSVFGGEIHEPSSHREDADDGEALAFGPGQKALHLVVLPARDVLEQSEGGDSPPLEWMAIGGCEACAGNAKVALDARRGRAAVAGRAQQACQQQTG